MNYPLNSLALNSNLHWIHWHKLYLGVYNHSCSCVCPPTKCNVGHATEWLEYSWIHLRSFGNRHCLYSNFQHIKTEKHGFSNFVFKTVEIRFVCRNDAFQSSLLFHLTIFFLTGNFCFQGWAPCAPQYWLASCFCLCWHNAAVRSQVESMLQLNLQSSPVNPNVIICATFAVLHCNTIICLLLLESLLRI